MFKIFSTDICRINIKWGIQRVILPPSYIWDARFLKVKYEDEISSLAYRVVQNAAEDCLVISACNRCVGTQDVALFDAVVCKYSITVCTLQQLPEGQSIMNISLSEAIHSDYESASFCRSDHPHLKLAVCDAFSNSWYIFLWA